MTANLKTRLKKLEAMHSPFDTVDDVLRKMNYGEPLNIGPDTHLGRFLQTVAQSPEYRRAVPSETTSHNEMTLSFLRVQALHPSQTVNTCMLFT